MALDGRIGSEIAAYRIERFVGRGGMGVVYQAEDTRLGRRVALKLLSTELADDDRFRDRFVRESRLAASLDHPNIVPIYAAGEADGQLYVAMRYVDGTDLRALIASEGCIEPARAVALISQIGQALDAAHDRGLVHRDVKAANVLLPSEGGHAYLTDFGLAKQSMSASAMTGTGQLVGTVDYLAPEVIEGHPADAAADQYALACLLYECLTGATPFRRPTEAATLWAHMQETVPPLPATCADLSPSIRRALAKSPADRYPTCAAFLDDVSQRLPQVDAPPPARLSGRRIAVALVVLVASTAAAVGITAYVAGGGSAAPRRAPPPDSLVAVDARTGTPLGTPIPVGRTPSRVVVSGGWVWVASVAGRTLTLVDARTRHVRRRIHLGATPTDIAPGSAGSVWVAEGLTRQVVHVFPDPDTAPRPVSLPGCCPGPATVAVGPGVVWVGDAQGVWRIDAGSRTARRADTGPAAGAAATDPQGNAWFTDGWGSVVYVNRDPEFRERHTQFGEPRGIAWGNDAAWVALPHAGAVTTFNQSGTGGPVIRVSGEPTAVAFGEGAVWVAASRAGTITRIDPVTFRRRTFAIGGRLTAVAAGDGAVWTTVEARSAVESGSGAVTYTDDSHRVVTTQVARSGQSVIVAGSVTNGMVDWSPDGRRLAYADALFGRKITTDPSCKYQACSSIHTMRSNGTGRLRLTTPKVLAGDVAPRWSPGGRQIAAWRDSRSSYPPIAQILIMDGGGHHQRIVRTVPWATGVTPELDWSPDGSHLVIQTISHGHPTLEVMRADGSDRRMLTVAEAYAPRWSPDGTRIAYFSSADGPGIYVTGADGQITHKVAATVVGSGTLAWSPDGRQLAFAYASDATSIHALTGDTAGWSAVYVINADGTGLSTLVPGPAGFPDWVPHA
ncbi:MAG TPA: protein kinase [Gaiellales bacterium]|nr:protein kinase [Gaiellales bacterium]